MDNFLKTDDGFQTTLKLMDTINHSTDDYLFIWDIRRDTRWFFGDIDKYYDIRKNGSETNNTKEMMRIIHPADRTAVLESLTQIAKGHKSTHNMDYRWVNRNGETVWINCHGTVIHDDEDKPYIMIGRVSEENLCHLYNPLTSLWNKNKLRQDLKEKLADGGGYLMFLDIDGLAAINLSRGRQYGDKLLKEVAEFCENLEGVNMAYHVDHNYFALILDPNSRDGVYHIYSKIRDAMIEKCTFTASAVPIAQALFLDEMQLLDSINMTLKKAKAISNNRIEFFSSEDLSKKIASLALLEELKQSVENDCEGFEVYYQPQLRVGNYDLYGVEALLRYNSKTRGKVFPDEFIPVLEQSGLIKDVGMWVLEQALSQCKKWRETLPHLRVSVNFSALQFEDPYLAEKVVDKVREAGLTGDALTVEITESMEIHNSEQIMNTMKYLKEYHINFALDDFGTGYSNLGYLKQMNVDEIKIDRVFVSGIEQDTYNHKLISNVIEFAKGNEIRTCCEGVESTRELVTLEGLLPDIIQGYLFDKPNTAEMIEKTYVNSFSQEFAQRTKFINQLYELKEKMGVVHFEPKDILRENGVGLWMMRINQNEKRYELHVDETMERLMAVDMKYTPQECYDIWNSNIHPDYTDYVKENIGKMIHGNKAVQIEFAWIHPQSGEVMVRFSGKRVNNSDGMIVLEGYYRMITDVIGACKGETEDEINSK